MTEITIDYISLLINKKLTQDFINDLTQSIKNEYDEFELMITNKGANDLLTINVFHSEPVEHCEMIIEIIKNQNNNSQLITLNDQILVTIINYKKNILTNIFTMIRRDDRNYL